MTSSSPEAADDDGGVAFRFQLVVGISEEYGKNCNSFQRLHLVSVLEVQKSRDHGKKRRTGKAGPDCKGAERAGWGTTSGAEPDKPG
jgi:hypothetical protein